MKNEGRCPPKTEYRQTKARLSFFIHFAYRTSPHIFDTQKKHNVQRKHRKILATLRLQPIQAKGRNVRYGRSYLRQHAQPRTFLAQLHEKIGIEMPPEDAYKYEGMRGVETIMQLFREQRGINITEEEAAEYYKAKSEAFNACPKATLMPGIKELMGKIKSCGMQIVVVTGSAQHTLLDKLEKELPGLVDRSLVVSALDVVHGKPNPEPYLKGLAKVSAKPNEAIVVENAPLGVRAGVAANVFTVACNTGPLPDSMLLDEGADLLFPSIAAFCDNWDGLSALCK